VSCDYIKKTEYGTYAIVFKEMGCEYMQKKVQQQETKIHIRQTRTRNNQHQYMNTKIKT
jgi:hypothetical protein